MTPFSLHDLSSDHFSTQMSQENKNQEVINQYNRKMKYAAVISFKYSIPDLFNNVFHLLLPNLDVWAPLYKMMWRVWYCFHVKFLCAYSILLVACQCDEESWSRQYRQLSKSIWTHVKRASNPLYSTLYKHRQCFIQFINSYTFHIEHVWIQ